MLIPAAPPSYAGHRLGRQLPRVVMLLAYGDGWSAPSSTSSLKFGTKLLSCFPAGSNHAAVGRSGAQIRLTLTTSTCSRQYPQITHITPVATKTAIMQFDNRTYYTMSVNGIPQYLRHPRSDPGSGAASIIPRTRSSAREWPSSDRNQRQAVFRAQRTGRVHPH